MNFYDTLPDGYIVVKTIDMDKNKKFAFLINFLSLFLAAAVFVPLVLTRGFVNIAAAFNGNLTASVVKTIAFVAALILYIVLHELVHGLFYKIFTRKKLRFGFNGFVAFCGVPNIYVKRGPMLVIILAPLVLFALITVPFLFSVEDDFAFALISLFLAAHISGCIGDIYGALYMIFSHGKNKMLINDVGPVQTFYVETETA